jgi:hypothetical protein
MKKITSLKIIILATTLLLLIGCRSNPVVYNVNAPVLTYGQTKPTLEQVEKEIVVAATSLGWSVKRVEPGKVTATLLVRQHRAVVDIGFTVDNFNITYSDSENLKYDGTNIHSNYNRWIKRLENTISTRVSAL